VPEPTNYNTEFLIGRISAYHSQILKCQPPHEGNDEQIVLRKYAAFDYMMSKVSAVNFIESRFVQEITVQKFAVYYENQERLVFFHSSQDGEYFIFSFANLGVSWVPI